MYRRVYDKGFHFDTLSFCDGDGHVQDVYYFGSEKLYGYRAFRIIRKLLINEMKQMLADQGVEIQFNKRFARIVAESADASTSNSPTARRPRPPSWWAPTASTRRCVTTSLPA